LQDRKKKKKTSTQIHNQITYFVFQPYLADIISVVGMTNDSTVARDTLNFKLQGTKENVSFWGHEYLRHLASEISEEYAERVDNQKPVDDILVLVDQIVPHNVEHNAEAEACDLLMEVRCN